MTLRRLFWGFTALLCLSGSHAAVAEENLLGDGAFDEGTVLSDSSLMNPSGGWHIRIGTEEIPAGEIALDTAEGGNAPGAVRLSNSRPEEYSCITQLIEVEPDSNYMLRGRVKTGTLNTLEDSAGARLCIGEAVPPSRSLFASPVAKSDSDWHEVAVYFNSGERDRLKVLVYLHKTTGTVWFDDLELIKL